MSVNLSARQLAHAPTSPARSSDALGDTGLPPEPLRLEITESALMDEADASPSRSHGAARASACGSRSTTSAPATRRCATCKRFPLDVLKIDRSFVAGLGAEPRGPAIVAAVIEMGRALGLAVVAEGVETAEQRDRLHELGCDFAQGFLFARPMPAAEVSDLPETLGGRPPQGGGPRPAAGPTP